MLSFGPRRLPPSSAAFLMIFFALSRVCVTYCAFRAYVYSIAEKNEDMESADFSIPPTREDHGHLACSIVSIWRGVMRLGRASEVKSGRLFGGRGCSADGP